jgi:hypothetical protein
MMQNSFRPAAPRWHSALVLSSNGFAICILFIEHTIEWGKLCGGQFSLGPIRLGL